MHQRSHTEAPTRVGRLAALLVVALAVALPLGAAAPAGATTAGQICPSSKVGSKDKDASTGATLTCSKDGARTRWVASGAASTKAPVTTKAPATTKATTKKATTAKATTKKATTKKSGSTSGPVNGRFCARDDIGKTAKDPQGRKLTCKASSNNRARWSLS